MYGRVGKGTEYHLFNLPCFILKSKKPNFKIKFILNRFQISFWYTLISLVKTVLFDVHGLLILFQPFI